MRTPRQESNGYTVPNGWAVYQGYRHLFIHCAVQQTQWEATRLHLLPASVSLLQSPWFVMILNQLNYISLGLFIRISVTGLVHPLFMCNIQCEGKLVGPVCFFLLQGAVTITTYLPLLSSVFRQTVQTFRKQVSSIFKEFVSRRWWWS